MGSAGNPGARGKWAEGKVRDALRDKSDRTVAMHFMRLPDARAGSFQPTTADFLLMCRGKTTLLEVKEVAHMCRLPSRNFDPEQRGRLRLWTLAGAEAVALVNFTPLRESLPRGATATHKMWRMAPVAWFTSGVPSWDMSALPLISLNEAMEALCNEP